MNKTFRMYCSKQRDTDFLSSYYTTALSKKTVVFRCHSSAVSILLKKLESISEITINFFQFMYRIFYECRFLTKHILVNSFEHPKHMLVLMNKTIIITLCSLFMFTLLKTRLSTVVPNKRDSDVILCLQLISKTLACTLYISIRQSIDHLCFNPIHRIGLIHK